MRKTSLLPLLLFPFSAVLAQTNAPFNTQQFVDINDIKASTLVHGDMWWQPDSGKASCEWPKNSGKHVQFASALWMGGFDPQAQPHVSAQTYRQSGNDFWPGPIDSTNAMSYASSQAWAKIWKVNRSTIDSFNALGSHTLANTPAVILEWPAKGNPYAKGNNNAALTINRKLAPFTDVNNDGIYNALQGDYPNIKGDQMLWWIFNDNGPVHSQTNAQRLKVEVQASAYAYKANGILDRTIYYEYKISNRSPLKYDSFTVGLFSDVDLGYAFDDFIGFDSSHRMAIGYNGKSVDGSGQQNSYGASIPSVGVSLVEYPGDNVSTHSPAGSFMFYNNDMSTKGNPTSTMHYYGYMTGSWKDGSLMTDNVNYSGPGNPIKYIFPGDPAVPLSFSECGRNNIADDRRFVLNTKTFSLPAMQQDTFVKLAYALLVQPNAGGCPSSQGFTGIRSMADSVWYYYWHKPKPSTGVNSVVHKNALKLYPNPAHDALFADISAKADAVIVCDAMGRKLECPYVQKDERIAVTTSSLPPGIYHISVFAEGKNHTAVFIKE